MTDMTFDSEIALEQFVGILAQVLGRRLESGRVIRDVFGRLSFATSDTIADAETKRIRESFDDNNFPYLAAGGPLLLSGSPLLQKILEEHGIFRRYGSTGQSYRLLDRRIAGEDWMQMPPSILPPVPRFAFYGLKGGVGRSTALAISAADLATHGLNVLVLDLDLEAPGLGSILLRLDQQPRYGVLDWLAAGAAGIDLADLIPDMVGGSPFTSGAGVVDVVPATGKTTAENPTGFLSKLARAYTPGAARGPLAGLSFTQKIEVLLGDLATLRKYDAILLDVRAGLHETSAASLLGLGARAFLFGTNSAQTAAGFRVLLSSVRQTLESWPDAPDLRDRLRMVQGRTPASTADRLEFRSVCWRLWLDTLYDSVGVDPDPSAFSFDLDDRDGPHYPWVIPNSDVYSVFDPQKEQTYLQDTTYLPVFNEFVSNFRDLVMNLETQ